MANPGVQSFFNPEIEGDPHSGLVIAHDELRAVEEGLWGLMNLICDGRKMVKVNTEQFHFAVEPLLHRLGSANRLMDRARQRLP